MMWKIELSILVLLLAVTGATCLPDQLVVQKLPLAERLHRQATKAHVPVAEATAYNPSLHTTPPVIASPFPILATNNPPPPPPPSSPPPLPPRPPATSTSCPTNTISQLGPCAGLVIGGGIVSVQLVMGTCCPVLEGLATLEAQLCLCTSLGPAFNFNMDLVRGVLEACGRMMLPGPVCFISSASSSSCF